MTITQWKWLYNITIILVFLTIGFFMGRKTIDTKTEIVTEYIKGDTITDTLYYPKPYKVVEPIDTLSIIRQCIKDGIYKELWPERVITEYVEINKADTTTIIKDWATKRFYSETLFSDDKNGTCTFDAEIQYNRMNVVGYNFIPMTKVVSETKYSVKTFSPFVGLNFITNPWDNIKNPSIQVNGGFFVKEKYGIQAIYQRGLTQKNDYVGGGFLIKF